MAKMFDEKKNDYFERLNDGYGWCKGSIYDKDDKNVWCLRLKDFVSLKNETLDELKSKLDYLLDKLQMFEIKLTDAEKVAKLADALPAEWDDVLKSIKQDSGFSKLHSSDFIKKLKKHSYENDKKKKELMDKKRESR